MEDFMKAIGKTISVKVEVMSDIQMGRFILANLRKEKPMAMAFSSG